MSKQSGVLFADILETHKRFTWDHEYVNGSLGSDVAKGEAMLIAIDLIAGNLTPQDARKDRVLGHGKGAGGGQVMGQAGHQIHAPLISSMLARCLSASLLGFDAIPVTVEVNPAPGLPGLQLVGLPDTAIQESRERVRAALRNSGFRGPLVRVVVNLAPADLRKEGPAFDLPIALALLVASGQLDAPVLNGLWCAGELGLDGSIRPCRGILAIACQAAEQDARALAVSAGDAAEASLVTGLLIRSASTLRELVDRLRSGPTGTHQRGR